MPVVTPPVVDPNKIPGIIKTPTTGQTYNPVTPERLAQIAADWQTMGEPARQAATRNQAAAIEAHRRIQERAAQKKEMEAARLQEKRDRYREALALQRRQEREYTATRRQFNRDLTNRQAQRVLQQQTLRANRADRLAIQRANEKKAVENQRTANANRNAILARNRQTAQTNAANQRLQQGQNWRNWVNSTRANTQAGARTFFNDMGANYDQYAPVVNQAITRLMATLNPGEKQPEMFAKIGEDTYNQLLNRGRTGAQQRVQSQFGPGFESRLLPDTALNPTIQGIQSKQFGEAQEYIDALLNRGVITQPGYDKALQNLQGQQGRVNTQLQDIGNDILAGGRQSLTDIGNTAGTAAGNLQLGGQFSAAPFGQQTAAAIKKFNQGLQGQFDTQLQGKSLFDTTNLANVAGRASGGQNTAFDPYAIQGTAQPKQPLFQDVAGGMKSVF